MSDSTKPEFKYWAFISYSHRDKAWGDWLHRSLETYKVPKKLVGRTTTRGEAVPRRVFPVFRDREELPTAADLGANLRNAIEQSRYLLIICSPNSAKSQWVNEEILSFKRLGRENRVLALIVDGEPYASDGKAGFTADQECFPEALRYKLGPDGELSEERTEPIAGDARPHADGKRQALIKLLAGVVGVNYDELRQRERARQRRRRLWLGFAAAAIAVVALFIQTQFKAEQREREFQAATAELGHARSALNENEPANAAIAALNAIETAESAGRELEPAWRVLRRALDANRVANRWIAADDALQECGFDREGKRLLTFNAASGVAKIWSVPEGRLLATCPAGEYAGLAGWIHDSDEVLTVRSWETPAKSWSEPGKQGVDLVWWDPATGERLRSKTISDAYYLGLRYATDDLPKWIHLTDTSGDISGFRLVRLSDGWSEQVLPKPENGSATSPEIVADCGVALLVDPATGAHLYPLDNNGSTRGQLEGVGPHEGLRVTSIVPSVDGASFAALLWSGQDFLQAGVWQAADGRRIAAVSGDAADIGSSAWLRPVPPDVLVSRSSDFLESLAPALGRQPLKLDVYDASGFAWNGSPTERNSVAAILDPYGAVSILRPQIGWRSEVALEGANATTIALNSTGQIAAIGDDRGGLTLWQTEPPFSIEQLQTARDGAGLDLTIFGANDGAHLAVRTAADELHVWDVAARREAGFAGELYEPAEGWLRFLVNFDAGWLLSAPSLPVSGPPIAGSHASFHDLKTGETIGRRPAADYILSSVGRRALSFQNGAWNAVSAVGNELVDTSIPSSRLAATEWTSSARFSADGSEVIIATSDGWIEIFDAGSGEKMRQLQFAEEQETSINQLHVSPSGRWLLLATYAKWWQVDLDSGTSKEIFLNEDKPDTFGNGAFLDDEQILAGTAGGTTRWWRYPDLALLGQVTGNYTVSETDTESGSLLLQSAWDNEVMLVEKDGGTIRTRIPGVVTVGAGGEIAVIENSDSGYDNLRIIRIEDGEILAEIANFSTSDAAIAPDGSRAVFVNEADGRVVSLAIPFDAQDLRKRAEALRERLAR